MFRFDTRPSRGSQLGCVGLLCAGLAWSGGARSETAPTPPAPAAAEPAAAAPSVQAESPIPIPSPEEMNADPAAAGLALFDLLEGAERAEKNKDYATAVKYYLTLARIVPEHATAFSKLCEMYEYLGQRDQGVAACFHATGLEGAKVADNLRYLRLLLNTPEGRALTPNETTRVRETLDHLVKAGVESAEVDVLGCQYAVAIENREGMRGCVQRLEQTQPGTPVTLAYKLSLALFERDFGRARSLIAEARTAQMSPESLALMETQLDAMQNGPREAGTGPLAALSLPWLASLGALAALVAAGLAIWSKRRRPKTA